VEIIAFTPNLTTTPQRIVRAVLLRTPGCPTDMGNSEYSCMSEICCQEKKALICMILGGVFGLARLRDGQNVY
jgi:hypothetical protein